MLDVDSLVDFRVGRGGESSGTGRFRLDTERSKGPLFVSEDDDGVGGLLRLRICSSSSSSVLEALRVLKSRTAGRGVALGEISPAPPVGETWRPGVAAGGEQEDDTSGEIELRERGEWPKSRR